MPNDLSCRHHQSAPEVNYNELHPEFGPALIWACAFIHRCSRQSASQLFSLSKILVFKSYRAVCRSPENSASPSVEVQPCLLPRLCTWTSGFVSYSWTNQRRTKAGHSSGVVWESRWTSWAVRPSEPSGFRGRKDLFNRASALVTTCP